MSQLEIPHNNNKICTSGKLKPYAKSGKPEKINTNSNVNRISGTLITAEITDKTVSGIVVVIGTLKKGPIPVALSLK